MSQDKNPAFTTEQKQLAAKKFRQWRLNDGRSVSAICVLLDIRRRQKLYEFINGGMASAATVMKVLRLIGLSPRALLQPDTGRRRRARMVRPPRFPVEISCTEEQLAQLGNLVDVLRASNGKKQAAQLRTQFKQIGQLVGTYLAARYLDSRQLKRTAYHRASLEVIQRFGPGYALALLKRGVRPRRRVKAKSAPRNPDPDKKG